MPGAAGAHSSSELVAEAPAGEPEPEPIEVEADADAVTAAEPPEPEPEPQPVAPDHPELTPMLANTNDPGERRKGIDNLMKRNDDEAIRLHVYMVTNEPDSTVRQHALDTLVQRMDDANGDYWIMLEGVLYALQKGGERDATVAAQALGRNSQNPDDLKAGLKHWSAKVRRESVEAVWAMENKAPLDYDFAALLEPMLQDSDKSVQRKTSAALSDLR
jgi:hypothetical protein